MECGTRSHRTQEEIVRALREGRFYASTGVVITSITANGHQILIETENADRIVAQCDTGCRIAEIDDPVAEIDVPDNITYVRFECWGRAVSLDTTVLG